MVNRAQRELGKGDTRYEKNTKTVTQTQVVSNIFPSSLCDAIRGSQPHWRWLEWHGGGGRERQRQRHGASRDQETRCKHASSSCSSGCDCVFIVSSSSNSFLDSAKQSQFPAIKYNHQLSGVAIFPSLSFSHRLSPSLFVQNCHH